MSDTFVPATDHSPVNLASNSKTHTSIGFYPQEDRLKLKSTLFGKAHERVTTEKTPTRVWTEQSPRVNSCARTLIQDPLKKSAPMFESVKERVHPISLERQSISGDIPPTLPTYNPQNEHFRRVANYLG